MSDMGPIQRVVDDYLDGDDPNYESAITHLAEQIDALSVLREMKASVLSLKPGDTLVLKHPMRLSDTARENIEAWVKGVLGCKCIVLQEGMDVAMVGREEHQPAG